jgi:glycine cleavage system aminomethyltransferase T
MSALAFLSPTGAADTVIARSPMERLAKQAGARFEIRDGWNVAVDYGHERPDTVAWADLSHLPKHELHGETASGEFGTARRNGDAWWCPLTPSRALIIGGTDPPQDALDVTCNYAALTILGPQARETIARFCAIDLRPHIASPSSFRPGSIARQPGMILVEAENRFLLLFGWAIAEYMWTVVEDAAQARDGRPLGIDALNEHA